MIIALVILGALAFVIAFFVQPSIDYDDYQARRLIAAREQGRRKAERREATALRRQERAVRAADAATHPQPRPVRNRSRAWIFDFANQMRSIT